MGQAVDIAVIPAAGRGTRMLPATRTLPKAMLPVVDRPAVQYAVEEVVAAGAGEVVIVADPGSRDQIEEHFADSGPAIAVITQEEPAGLGHAILCARDVVGDRPFLCALVDRITHPRQAFFTSMMEAGTGSVLALIPVDDAGTSTHGIVASDGELGTVTVTGAVEKPGPVAAPSRLGIVGRYVLTPTIFAALADASPGVGGEIQLTDAIDRVARTETVLGVVMGEDLLDVGTPLGLAIATTVLGAADVTIGDAYRAFLDRFEP